MSACNIYLNEMEPAAGTIRAISAEGGLFAAGLARFTGEQRLRGESA